MNQKMMNWWRRKGFELLLFVAISMVFVGFLCYLLVFHRLFSVSGSEWANFGNFMTGVASIANLLIFISISLLLKRIDNNGKEIELKYNKRFSAFERFLDSYELLLKELLSLKVSLLSLNAQVLSQKGFNGNNVEGKLISSSINIRHLSKIMDSYIEKDGEVSVDVKIYEIQNSFAMFHNSVNEQKDELIILNNIKNVVRCIDDQIEIIGVIIKNFLNKNIHINEQL
ncbi:hypothetical protein HGB13_03535 [bacterium]|nr:hypothetical protein [bacterium]